MKSKIVYKERDTRKKNVNKIFTISIDYEAPTYKEAIRKLDESMLYKNSAEIESTLFYFDSVIPPENRLKKERQLVDEAKALALRIRLKNGN